MGNSKSYIPPSVFENLESNLHTLGIPSFDQMMKANQQKLSQIEKIRYTISLQWAKIIFDSGAIVIKHPRFASCLQGLLNLIARDDNSNPLEVISFNKSPPIIRVVLPDDRKMSEANKKLLEDILIYSNLCKEISEEVMKLKKSCIKMESNYNSNYDFWLEEIKKEDKNSYKLEEFLGKSSENKRLICKAKWLTNHMVNMVNQIIEDSAIFERKFREKNYSISEKNKFDKINDFAKIDDSYKNQMKLFWNFTEEKKLHEFEDWNIIQQKIKANKEIIIENNPIFITLCKETEANNGHDIINNHLTKGVHKSSNEIKKQIDEENVHQEGSIKEPPNSIGSNKIKYYQPKEKIGLKNWLISLKQSISLEEESKDIYPTCFEQIAEKDIIVIGSNKGEIYLLDKSQGLISKKFKKMSGKIKSLCYLNDEGSFLSGSKDGIIVRWYLDDTEPIIYRFKQQQRITSIVYTGNRESAFVSIGPNILLFNILTFQQTPKFKIDLKKDISVMKWSETNLITGHINGEINVIDYSSKAILITYSEQVLKIKDICFLNYIDSMAIVACSKDKSVKMFSKSEKKLLKVLEVSPADIYPVRLSYCYDTKTIIVCYNNGNFFTVNYFTGKKKYHYSKESRITGCLYPGDSSSIVFGNVEGNIDIFAVK